MKIQNRSPQRSHKCDGIGVERIGPKPFPLTTPSLTFRLWSSENHIVGVGNGSGWVNQLQCTFPCFVIGLVLLLLLATPTTQFSLDRKRRSRKRYQNAVFISSSSSTLLITTPTPSLVKTSLKPLPYLAVDHVPENSTTMSTNFLTRLIAKKKNAYLPPVFISTIDNFYFFSSTKKEK